MWLVASLTVSVWAIGSALHWVLAGGCREQRYAPERSGVKPSEPPFYAPPPSAKLPSVQPVEGTKLSAPDGP